MAITLRAYQRRDVQQIERSLARYRRVLYALATGAGKTITYARVVRRAVKRGKRVLILVRRREILRQTALKLRDDRIGRFGVIWAGAEEDMVDTGAPVQLASVQTFLRRELGARRFDLIVVDEAHRAEFWPVTKKLTKKQRLLGVTGTPCRFDGKPLPYDALVTGPAVEELIADGWLSELDYITVPLRLDLRRVRRKGGDYDREDLGKRLSARRIVGRMPWHWKKYALGRPTVIFACSIEHGEMIVAAFKRARVRAIELLTGRTSDADRLAMIGRGGRLELGATKIVVTCDVLSEGWDLPELGCIVSARPTLSLTVWRQQCGRAMRAKARRPIVLDHAGNVVNPTLGRADRTPGNGWSLTERVTGDTSGFRIDGEGRVVDRTPEEVRAELVRLAKPIPAPHIGTPERERWRRLLLSEIPSLRTNDRDGFADRRIDLGLWRPQYGAS